MRTFAIRPILPAVLVLFALALSGCATTGADQDDEGEPFAIAAIPPAEEEPSAAPAAQAPAPEEAKAKPEEQEEPEVPKAVAETEHREEGGPVDELAEVIVSGSTRQKLIHNLVAEAQNLLKDVKLPYVFTGKGRSEVLRGRPVAFALWSEAKMEWTIANVEIPRPPVKWKPGGKPMPFVVTTPGIQATHVKGTGAERLMFSFTRDGEALKVYGRKFPVFDEDLLKKKQWRAVVATAKPIVYLPFTEDTFDPAFVNAGKAYLLDTAHKAIAELREARAPSLAYPGESLADIVPPEVITTLAVIEQTDDSDFAEKGEDAFDEVLSQYGLKRGEAYRYSVSRASAIGPMQFTNAKGRGTYAMVVRKCPAARLNPDFELGATDLLNAMKAAICLFDLDLADMSAEIRSAYHDNMPVLGIFPVAAYNGGGRNVKKLQKVMKKANVTLAELGPVGDDPDDKPVSCPCLWKKVAAETRPVSLPKYNNENRWYIEKYQRILSVFQEDSEAAREGG